MALSARQVTVEPVEVEVAVGTYLESIGAQARDGDVTADAAVGVEQ